MLKGSIVALVTPFLKDGNVNYDKFKELILYHVLHYNDGISILTTTGESSSIPLKEKIKMIKIARKLINKTITFIVGICSNNMDESIKLAKLFSSLGADYLLVVSPYYIKPNDQGMFDYYSLIAANSTCPIILYNVPSRTGSNISINVLSKLSKNKNIIGIKEASGDIEYAKKVVPFLNDNFILLSGNDELTYEILNLGGEGVISVLANIAPNFIHYLTINKLPMNKKMMELAKTLFIETNPIPIKAIMNYLGFDVGETKLPLGNISKEHLEIVIDIVEKNRESLNI
ncbi:MAG: 4-hydroxy-tetrahydrodipicolinate synthase [Bacillales bacterium]|nr:4-hydroxy-tetrahydrodipicolinate synthase [Bacillales bacterium]